MDFKNAKQIYVGGDNICRCGCAGNYHQKGSRGYKMALTRLDKLIKAGGIKKEQDHVAEFGYMNFSLAHSRRPEGTAITLYFEKERE